MNIENDKFNLSLGSSGYWCITGTNFNTINEIIYGIDNFFGSKKDIDIPFSVLDGDLKFNKKDYVYFKISPLFHSMEEIEVGKTSYIRKIVSDITDSLDEEFKIYDKISKAISSQFDDKNAFNYSVLNELSLGLENVKLQFTASEINKKIFLDSILSLNFIKNEKENERLTNFEITIIVLNILQMLLSMNLGKKILILIDNVEYKMNKIEKETVLAKILDLCSDKCLVLHFTNDLMYKYSEYQIKRAIIVNDKIISNILDDKIIRDAQDSYPGHLEYEMFIDKYVSSITNYFKYLSKQHYLLIKDDISIDDKKMLWSIDDVYSLDIGIDTLNLRL